MVKEVECIVTGRVQVVMFRDFTKRNADKLGIVGTVENLDDGSVRAVLQGEEKAVEKLVEKLHKGPPLAHVTGVTVTEKEALGDHDGFTIIYKY